MNLQRFGNLWIDPACIVAACIEEEDDYRNKADDGTMPKKYVVRCYFVSTAHVVAAKRGEMMESEVWWTHEREKAEATLQSVVDAANGAACTPDTSGYVSVPFVQHVGSGAVTVPPRDDGEPFRPLAEVAEAASCSYDCERLAQWAKRVADHLSRVRVYTSTDEQNQREILAAWQGDA